MFLFVALFSVSFDVSESRAQECIDTIDNIDGDGLIDFGAGPGFDPECTSRIDDDEATSEDTYISFRDPDLLIVHITRNCGAFNACITYDGDTDGCTDGWICLADDIGAPCYVGVYSLPGVACDNWAGTNCSTIFEACNCTCTAAPPGPGVCGDGKCDYDDGENMFNCPDDCLPAGIPDKLIPDVIDSIISWLLTFAVAISVLILIYGGVCYVFSSGDAQKVENAKKIVKYALLGIFVVGISYAILEVLDTIF